MRSRLPWGGSSNVKDEATLIMVPAGADSHCCPWRSSVGGGVTLLQVKCKSRVGQQALVPCARVLLRRVYKDGR